MPTPTEMQTRTRLARLEAERLAAYLGTLSDAGWEHPTACDLWQVGDVVGHLVWIGEFYVTFITRALAGDVTPPPGSPRDERYAGLPPEDFYDLKAREYRDFLGNQILPTFVRRFEALSQALESLTPDDYEKPCFYHSGNRPVWTLADLTVQELAVHAWDIQSHRTRHAAIARQPARAAGTGGATAPTGRALGPNRRQSRDLAVPTFRRRQPRL